MFKVYKLDEPKVDRAIIAEHL